VQINLNDNEFNVMWKSIRHESYLANGMRIDFVTQSLHVCSLTRKLVMPFHMKIMPPLKNITPTGKMLTNSQSR